MQCQELEIFNEKFDVLFDFLILSNKTSTFSLNIFRSRHCTINSKYSFDGAKSRL